jgi:hypothetical protein
MKQRFIMGQLPIASPITDFQRDLLGYFNNPTGTNRHTAPNAGIWDKYEWQVGGDMLRICLRCERLAHWFWYNNVGGLVGIWDVPDLVEPSLPLRRFPQQGGMAENGYFSRYYGRARCQISD